MNNSSWMKIALIAIIISIPYNRLQSKEIVKSNIIKGRIIDSKKKEPIAFATIYVHELEIGTTSSIDGDFSLSTSYSGRLRLTITSIGYQPADVTINLPSNDEFVFTLTPSSYNLDEVVVVSKEGDRGNSISLIGRAAMQHIQPSSFADLLQLLPGHSTKQINMSQSNFITMRQAGSDVNTSLGTSFIIDGIQMNNDANMQSFYGLSSDNALAARTTTNKGIDMRTISTDRIESVEVIRGIPSAKYGDVTAGVVKIELKTGQTPWEERVKVDLKNKLFSVGKGFILPKKQGAINFDVDYAEYNPDNRSNIVNYSRTTVGTRYENKFAFSENTELQIKGNLSYTGSFDNVKTDAETLGKEGFLKTRYNNFAGSVQANLKMNNKFVKQISYKLSYTITEDDVDQYQLVTVGGRAPLTTLNKEEGEFETIFLPTEYFSRLKIDGKPIYINTSLDLKSDLKTGHLFHSFSYGFNFTHDKNKGAGAIFDPYRPPYVNTKSARARAFKDIPAMERLSVYLEDNIKWKIGNTDLLLQPGIRLTTLPSIDDKYQMSGKLYSEPRFNMKFTFPKFKLAGENSSISLTGGIGKLYKFPTLSQLYPDKIYSDYVQLNYFSNTNEEYQFANVKTYITDPTNYKLTPAKNLKYEFGFVFVSGNKKLDITFFKEKMDNGFSTGNLPSFHSYTYYDASSVINPTSKPTLDQFSSTTENTAVIYNRMLNDAGVYKTGIEYTLSLGKIHPIYTSIWINGAWFKTHYTFNDWQYKKPTMIINDRPYKYVGVYDYNKEAKERSQFNTNINFDTHIPFLRMIFTTSIQTMWFETTQRDYNTRRPFAYIDELGNWHDFTPEMAEDNVLKQMIDTGNNYAFLKDRTAMDTRVNLKLSKEIGDNVRLACYFNNSLTYMPDYTSYTGVRIADRKNSSEGPKPYFGAELNIKF